MKVKVDEQLTDIFGNPAVDEKKEPITFKQVAITALLYKDPAPTPQVAQIQETNVYDRYKLANAIVTATGEVNMKIEEAALLKKHAENCRLLTVVAQGWLIKQIESSE
ncbi:hypothetical protein [Hoeflea poritis]|uniref:Uncharacterized protein n=1 Tax=Hoeflea poritis TaxID=2993659 RepID=A0ABT4VH85_9HYPH|nr:hypothetical protein [Hoeflea poritis]MDA4843969.1 hypothetical protein [Hoeflea poritis]